MSAPVRGEIRLAYHRIIHWGDDKEAFVKVIPLKTDDEAAQACEHAEIVQRATLLTQTS